MEEMETTGVNRARAAAGGRGQRIGGKGASFTPRF